MAAFGSDDKYPPLLTQSIDPLRVDINSLLPRSLRDGMTSGVSGLQNAGNTCFMNSTLQCLMATDLLRNRVLSFLFQLAPDEPLTDRLYKYLRLFWTDASLSSVSSSMAHHRPSGYWSPPTESKQVLPTASWVSLLPSWLAGYQQQDAQEFLIWLLDNLREEAKKVMKTYPGLPVYDQRIRQSASSVVSMTDNASLKSTRLFADTWIDEIFANLTQSNVTCSCCGTVTDKYESNNMISLQLPLEKLGLPIVASSRTRPIKLEECLDAYFQPEMIEEFACLNCTLVDRVVKATNAAASRVIDKLPSMDISSLQYQIQTMLTRCESMNISSLQEKVTHLMESTSDKPKTDIHALYQLQDTLEHTNDKLKRLKEAFARMKQEGGRDILMICLRLIESLESLLIELESIDEIVNYLVSISTAGAAAKYPKMVIRSASRKQSVYQQPSVLILHIKRFHIDMTTSTKLQHVIQFPLDMDLKNHMSTEYLKALSSGQSLSSTRYELYGLVEHLGQLNSGHYVAYVQKPNGWYRCSDSVVTQVPVDQVLRAEPYMLFYRRY